MTKKILAGITQDNELYFLEIEPTNNARNGYNEFSMSGETVRPITLEEAKENANNYLDSEGEYFWRQAVESKNTTLGLDDWIEQVKSEDEMGSFDNSLFPEEIEVDGETYVFESCSCGQHEEEGLKHYFIPKESFMALMKIWKEYHLKATPKEGTHEYGVITNFLNLEQDINDLAAKAVKIINNQD